MSLRRRDLLAAAPALTLAGCAKAQSMAPTGSLQRIVDETGVPALAGAVVTADGLPFLDAAGLRHMDRPGRVTTGDLWHLGSNTKAMTAALYARLVEAGEARWGAVLPELFPDLTLDPAWSRTTIEQLMSHRAGIADKGIISTGWLIAAQQATSPLPEQRTALAAKALASPPVGTPGTFDYANLNFVLAGAAIERITKTPWEVAITERLFKPLGITTAGFGAPKGAQPWGHRRLPLGVGLLAMDPTRPADNPAALGPAGTAHMSLTDYAKFIRLFLTNGGDVLKPESITHLTTPPAGGDYALGWGVSGGKAWARGPRLGHEGSNTMWHMMALVAPGRGVGLITAANAMMPDDRNPLGRLSDQLQLRFAPV